MCKISILILSLVVSGCVNQLTGVEITRPELAASGSSWNVSAEAVLNTDILGRDFSVDDTSINISGVLRERPLHLNADETETWLLEYLDFSQGPVGSSLSTSNLTGKAITIRRFPGEQVLEISGGEHLSGFGQDDEQALETQRAGGVFDILLAVVNPAPPPIEVGEARLKMIRWPFSAQRGRNLRSYANVTWSHIAHENGLIHMTYEGTMSGQGRDSLWGSEIEVTGEASGEVWLDEVSGEVRVHNFDWLRVLSYGFSDSDARLSQSQHFTGAAQWLE